MAEQGNEKRKFKRIPFSPEKKMTAICTHSGNDNESITMNISNISAGGVGLIIKKDKIKGLDVADILILNQVVGHQELAFMKEIELEVKWILNSEIMEHVGFGCEFVNTSGSMVEKIQNFMDVWEP